VSDYVLAGGQEGYDRLALLASERREDTEALFERAGVGPGMRCADLGCGGGAVALQLAARVGQGGSVVGYDVDPAILALAREEADRRGAANVEFRAQDLTSWAEPAAYDVVYSRFVLQHLAEPRALLRALWDAVRPGGVLAVEDADHDGWSCYPPNAGFDAFVRMFCRVLRTRHGDPTFGRRLPDECRQLGIPIREVALVQPVRTGTDAGKAIAALTLEATTPAIVAEGVARDAEVAGALADLAAYAADPRTLMTGPRVFQVWARRR